MSIPLWQELQAAVACLALELGADTGTPAMFMLDVERGRREERKSSWLAENLIKISSRPVSCGWHVGMEAGIAECSTWGVQFLGL